VRLIYPSTGLLSQGDTNEYARGKKVLEDIHLGSGMDALGIRIFATYGPGEGHKRDYASVPYLFARDMVQGRSPIIFGDGSQVRDFIYIDDTVQGILALAEECPDPIVDLGSGEQVTFRQILGKINSALGDIIQAKYVDKPTGYVDKTKANIDRLSDFYEPKCSIDVGIKNMVDALKRGNS
jgi:UDP-glucose 4-epimerase